MKKMPSLILVEPAVRHKQHRLAKIIYREAVEYSQEEVKQQLKQIRYFSVENMSELSEKFSRSIANYSDAHLTFASDAAEAVAYINDVVKDTRSITIGKSSTVNELRSGLEKSGYELIDSYSSQFLEEEEREKKINYPWQFPLVLSQSAWDTFDYSREPRQQAISGESLKDVVALLAVNAASAEDGSVFFLQHSANIGTLLNQARRLVLVIGLERIVKNSGDALFQARCAGAFGMESVILDLKIGDASQGKLKPWEEMPETTDLGRELHIILLDNGRRDIAKGHYKDLLYCIGCRACAKQCLSYRNLNEFGYFPKEYLWSVLIGYNPSIELCAQCAMCQVECPIDIPIPKLMARAKAEYFPKIARKIDNQALMNMTRLAPLMSLFAPLVNLFSGIKPLRILIEKIIGIDRRRKAPAFHYETFERWFRSRHE